MATISGIGGSCGANPRYQGPPPVLGVRDTIRTSGSLVTTCLMSLARWSHHVAAAGNKIMKALVLTVGVFASVVGAIMDLATRAAAEQNYPWCINKPDTPPQCRYATLEQCLSDRLGKGGSCSPSPYAASPYPAPSARTRRAKQ